MNYQQTLDYLYTRLPMFQRMGAPAFKKDLSNTIALCNLLQNPEQRFKSIHIAGTNGKGSVSHILAAILQSAGYKVGLYTSPHYKDFRERIKINGQYIGEQEVVDFVSRLQPEIERIDPSFFEITVAMAFWHFAEQDVDVAIIETGLGGRLDSTNVITPLLSVITNIGYDHQQFLGDTLPEIATEKAGIIKPNVAVLIGERQEDVERVFIEKAASTNSSLQFAEDMIKLSALSNNELQRQLALEGSWGALELSTDLLPDYQLLNIRTALSAAYLLKSEFGIHTEHIITALADIRGISGLMGRFQLLSNEPLAIADSAHNLDGIRVLLQELNRLSYKRLHVVYGTVSDKDISKILAGLPKDATYYFCQPDIPRGKNVEELLITARTTGLPGNTYPSVISAYEAALKAASKEDLVLVSGSIFVVAEVL